MNDAARLLELAADRLQRCGWTQHAAARDSAGAAVEPTSSAAAAYSAAGAIVASSPAVANDPDQRRSARIDAIAALYRSIPELAPHDRRAVVTAVHDWQDAPARSRAEVVAAMHRAAAQLRERR